MRAEKEIKAEFKKRAQTDPEKYYPVQTLIDEGFVRMKCKNCGNYFWSVKEREVCGEPDCSGGYTFIGDSPAKEKMDFIETWQKFSKLFKGFGYTPIPRYPVVARWRDDTDFVQASIYDFQPYCVSGEIDPPANPLVVPQFCLRFNDTDNVGITGRHYTGFVMIGQHAFMPPERYDTVEYLRHIYLWLTEGMKLPKDEIQFHEDAWAGGGNMGPSMEYFSRGLEIGNQVYMQYDITSGNPKDLDIKVLDMGMGQERPAWFTHGSETSYEANFGPVVKKLYSATGIMPDKDIIKRFLPYSGLLNMDEAENIDRVWAKISESINVDVEDLKSQIVPLSGVYSIGDHTRSLLLALSDGALPSNVGGGYNLRVLIRRALDFVYRYGWDIKLAEVCAWHAQYLKPQYPELVEHLDEVTEILDIERGKYRDSKTKSRRIVERLRGKEVSSEKLVELYDSDGISPEMLKEEGLDAEIPSDFYKKVSERHEKLEHAAQTKKAKEFDLNGVPKTEIMYYDDYALLEFSAKVLKILEGRYVVLDKTAFYPTSGGQLSDFGLLGGRKVVDVFKQGNVIIHDVLKPDFKEGDVVNGKIDFDRRLQLTQHHTATHIINGVSRKLLGGHIWQAGAEKTLTKSRLDITHYASLSPEKLREIEDRANSVIRKNLDVSSNILKRDDAEAKYGFRLYQGGAVPGKELRVVKIAGLDVEACGGTHVHSTGEVGFVKFLGSTKIQDGVVRLEYVAGEAARGYIFENVLKVSEEITGHLMGLQGLSLENWLKDRLAKIRSLEEIFSDKEKLLKIMGEGDRFKDVLTDIGSMDAELLESSKIFSVPRDQIESTFKRFVDEISERLEKISKLSIELETSPQSAESYFLKIKKEDFPEISKSVFDAWKNTGKKLEELTASVDKVKSQEKKKIEKIGGHEVLVYRVKTKAASTVNIANELQAKDRIVVVFGIDENISIVGKCDDEIDIDMGELVSEASKKLGGSGGGSEPNFAQGGGREKDKLSEAEDLIKRLLKEKLTNGK